MRVLINVSPASLLNMQPEELADFLHGEVVFDAPDEIDTDAGKKKNIAILNKATAYAAYFTEMELKAKTQKRIVKRNDKDNKDEIDRIMAIEDTFKAYKEMMKLYIENASKIMTMKRLELDEANTFGKMT